MLASHRRASKKGFALLKETIMERTRLVVIKHVGAWGVIYKIGGTEVDGEPLSIEQAEDLLARFEYEQSFLTQELCRKSMTKAQPST